MKQYCLESQTVLLPRVIIEEVMGRSDLRSLPMGRRRSITDRLVAKARKLYREDASFRRKLAACRNEARPRVLKNGKDAANVARDWFYAEVGRWIEDIRLRILKPYNLRFSIVLSGHMTVQVENQALASWVGYSTAREYAAKLALVAAVPCQIGDIEPSAQVSDIVEVGKPNRD